MSSAVKAFPYEDRNIIKKIERRTCCAGIACTVGRERLSPKTCVGKRRWHEYHTLWLLDHERVAREGNLSGICRESKNRAWMGRALHFILRGLGNNHQSNSSRCKSSNRDPGD